MGLTIRWGHKIKSGGKTRMREILGTVINQEAV